MRRIKREVNVGGCKIGGDNPIKVQGMVKSNAEDLVGVIEEVKKLYESGAKLVRLAVPNEKVARNIKKIKEELPFIPLIADIHFNPKLGILAVESGVDKVRINPGNIKKEKAKELLGVIKDKGVALRIGVNSGSLPSDYAKDGNSLAEYVLNWVNFVESYGIKNLILSVKGSSLKETILAYRILDKNSDYPLHLGITAAGLPPYGIIKSALGIGILLEEGIGDTLRVSITGSSTEEIKIGYQILQNLGLYNEQAELIVCPTCGRCRKNLNILAKEIENLLTPFKLSLKVAVMGCEVNGPGEAKDADIGIACSKRGGVIFKEGKLVEKVVGGESELISNFKKHLISFIKDEK